MQSKTECKTSRQNRKAEHKPMTKHRDRNARLDALIPCAPIPNFAFRITLTAPPARTDACAGAKTGRHKRRAGQQFIYAQQHAAALRPPQQREQAPEMKAADAQSKRTLKARRNA